MSIAKEPGTARIYTEEKPRRHPPTSERGVIGWIRLKLDGWFQREARTRQVRGVSLLIWEE